MSRVLASNAAKLYDVALADPTYLADDKWQFVPRLTANQVWDGFIILALLRDAISNQERLQVPHKGQQKDRFRAVMSARNISIICNGQPDAVRHACDRCLRVYLDEQDEICLYLTSVLLSIG